jgi:hypothetical protein
VPCDATRRILSRAVPLVQESRALNYALTMTLAATPRQEFTQEEVDAMCQLAYEVHNKLAKATELFQNFDNFDNLSDP